MHALSRALIALTLSGALLLGLAPRRGHAQALESATSAEPQADVPEAYLRAAKLGHDEYELRNYAEARARFLEAHQIFPNARSLRALGAVEYDLKNYAASIEYLQSALASDVRPLAGPLRTETEALLSLARGYVATYTFALEPAAAQLELDGERVSLRADATLLIEVGEHQLLVQAPGHLATRKTLQVTGGAVQTVHIKLLPAQQEQGERAEPLHKKWWLWTLVGVAVAGAAVGLGVGLSGREKEGEPTPSNLPGVSSISAVRFAGF